MAEKTIEWDECGYPTDQSLKKLEAALAGRDMVKVQEAFYSALKENTYDYAYGPAKVEVRGEVIDVWAYHTYGWSGNESIIAVLQTCPLWGLFLERYDAGGHYYFRPKGALGNGEA